MRTTAALALALGLSLTAAADAPRVERRGSALSKQAPIALAEVLGAPDKFAGRTVVTDGKVRANCTRKGCWMELATALDKAAPGCRVTFKDYGFFVPLDSKGASARVEGQVEVRVIPKEEVAHLEGEGGSFPGKLKDGSAREVRLVATGVELTR